MSFLEEHSIYVILIIAVVIMVGLLLYLTRIDGRIRRLERDK